MAGRRIGALLGAAAAASLLAGCGLGAGRAPGPVTLVVTRNFGAQSIPPRTPPNAVGEETIMSLLMRSYAVGTRYSGGFVESINGFSGGHEVDGEPRDWFYYVNGVEAPKGAAQTKVLAGDAIWWDLHDWGAAEQIPAVVGSFPEPFRNGLEGKHLPIRIECANVAGKACRTVIKRIDALGIPAGVSAVGPGGETPDTLRLAVGPWSAVRVLLATAGLTRGPSASGVFARIAEGGNALQLLNDRGQVAEVLRGSAGLLAAVRYPGEEPLWVLTGPDEAGALRAAEALSEADLREHFAIAISPRGRIIPLPVQR
jgi:hypothetical protein